MFCWYNVDNKNIQDSSKNLFLLWTQDKTYNEFQNESKILTENEIEIYDLDDLGDFDDLDLIKYLGKLIDYMINWYLLKSCYH